MAELVDAGLVQATSRRGRRPATVWIGPQVVADQCRREPPTRLVSEVHREVLAAPLPRAAGSWQALGRSRSLLWSYEQDTHEESRSRVPVTVAVQAANGVHQREVAADLCTHALTIDPRPELLRERAFARRFSGDTGGALEDLQRLCEQDQDVEAVIGIAEVLHYEHGQTDQAISLLASAAEDSADDAAERRLRAALVCHLAYGGRFVECEAAHQALPHGSPRIRGHADIAHAMVESHRGRTTQALRRLYRYQLMPHPDVPVWFTEELQGALFVCLLQAHGPRRTLTATGVLGSAEASPFVRFEDVSVLTARISVLLTQGRAREALRLALSVEASSEQDRSGFGAHALALGAEAAAYLGDENAARFLESRHRETPERAAGILRPNSEAALGAAALIVGEAGAAASVHHSATELARDGLFGAAVRVAHAGLRVADPTCAEFVTEWAPRTTGEVCAVFGEHGAALATGDAHRLSNTAERYLRLGFTVHAIEALVQAASLGAEQQIDDLAGAALSRARMIHALTDGLAAAHLAPVAHQPVELSRREREIALLVSQGASNRSIAQALVLSVRTVEGHLGRMYTKLGISGRRELASYMRRDTP